LLSSYETFEDPLIDVITLESIPPVQDSAKAIFSFFLLSDETIFLFKVITKI